MSDVGGKIDPTAVRLNDLANDRESETGTALLTGLSRSPRQKRWNTRTWFSGDTRTVISNGNKVPGVEPVGRHRDVRAVGRKSHRIGDQVGDGTPNRRSIAAHREDLGCELICELHYCGVGRRVKLIGEMTDELGEVELLLAHRTSAMAGIDEQVVDERGHALGRSAHDLACRPEFLGLGVGVGEHDIEIRADDGERVPELMAGLGDEVALVLERLVEPGEHVVEGVRELLQLVVRPFELDTA